MAFLWPKKGNETILGNILAKINFFFQKNTLFHSFHITVIPSESFRELQVLASSKSFPYPKVEKNGNPPEVAIYASIE